MDTKYTLSKELNKLLGLNLQCEHSWKNLFTVYRYLRSENENPYIDIERTRAKYINTVITEKNTVNDIRVNYLQKCIASIRAINKLEQNEINEGFPPLDGFFTDLMQLWLIEELGMFIVQF